MAIDDLWFSKRRGPDGERIRTKLGKQAEALGGRAASDGPKRWRVRWTDDQGKPQTRHFRRETDAKNWDAECVSSVNRGAYVDMKRGGVPLGDYAENWLAAMKTRQVDSTQEDVAGHVRNHIQPTALGRMLVRDIQEAHVRAWVGDRLAAGLAASSLRARYGTLSNVLAQAVRQRDGIAINPCPAWKDVMPRAGKRKPPPLVVPTPQQVHALADTLRTDHVARGRTQSMTSRYAAMCYVAAGCGLRLGEVFGLESDDIDWTARKLHVRRQLKLVGGRLYLADPKTETSVRAMDIPAKLVPVLEHHLDNFGVKPVEIEDESGEHVDAPVLRKANLIFTGQTGQPLQRPTFCRTFRAAAHRTGLRPPTGRCRDGGFHVLRHFFATELIHGGANVVQVQLALGHATPMVTLTTYVHAKWVSTELTTGTIIDGSLWGMS